MARFQGRRTPAIVAAVEDFQEEEIWDMSMSSTQSSLENYTSSPSPPKHPFSATTSRRIAVVGRSSTAATAARYSSAPVEIPDWSKVQKHRMRRKFCDDDDDDEDGDDDEDVMVPPHEYLARRNSETTASVSMCEGVGRTLKGRDLCKLRNAVLSKTGFLE